MYLGNLSRFELDDDTRLTLQAKVWPGFYGKEGKAGRPGRASVAGSVNHGWHSIFYLSLPIAGFIALAIALSLPEKRAARWPPPPPPSSDFFGLALFSLGMLGLQMMLDRGERLEWFASPEIWIEAIASVLGFYLFIVHVLTTDVHFLNKALFKDRNFILSAIMFFAVGFVLLPTLALTVRDAGSLAQLSR